MSLFRPAKTRRERRSPVASSLGGEEGQRLAVSWGLIASLGAIFLVVWLAPPLDFLKISTLLMPTAVHTALELAAVVIAMLSFAVAWHAYDARRPANILILGCGLLCVALVDVGHLLSYLGMPDFITPSGPEKSITFWLYARLIAALALLVTAMRAWPPLRSRTPRLLLLGLSLAMAGLAWWLALDFPHFLPRMYIEGEGLTTVKIGLEYLVIGLLLVAGLQFHRQRAKGRHAYDSGGLITAVAVSILSELCFTLYTNVTEVFSLLGHAYKVIAYLFIYRAVFLVSVRAPYVRLRQEVAERRAVEKEIRHRVYHDPVTGLPNRLMLEEQLRARLELGQSAALMAIDVDHFKPINDAVGITAGDQLLRQVGQRLEQGCGQRGLVARSAADSFLLLMANDPAKEAAQEVVNDLMAQMRRPCHAADMDFPLTVSIGIALAPRDGRDFDSLKHNADIAMTRAKQLGRNNARFFDRYRSPAALAPSAAGHDHARPLHRRGRRHRPHQCAGRLGIARSLPPDGAMASRRLARPVHGLECLAGAIPSRAAGDHG
jgi:diguanylate cyclase (GGDEF)-like protein